MAEDTFQEKTEPATSKRREDARNKGQVLKSAELNSAVLLMSGLLILYFGGAALANALAEISRTLFVRAMTLQINEANIHRLALDTFGQMGMILFPLILGLMIAGVLANVLQVGFLFSGEAITPSLNKLNPLVGIKKVLVSRRSAVEAVKNIAKIGVVGLAGYSAIDSVMAESMTLVDSDPGAVLGFMTKGAFSVGLRAGLAFLALAILDYLYQRFEYERGLRMTKEEVKEEEKQTEGDPLIKSRVRAIQRRIAYRRMMQDVPTADVVVTNPTHYAVALKYAVGEMPAPRVVAKGADLVAQRIKDLARAHGVPIVEDRILAQSLYKSVDLGEEIPEKLFQSVAQILAYIYRVRTSTTLRNSTN